MANKPKLDAARALIKEKEYDAAREVLRTMGDDPTARSWLIKLDKIDPLSGFRQPTDAPPPKKAWRDMEPLEKGGILTFVYIAFLVVFFCGGCWLITLIY